MTCHNCLSGDHNLCAQSESTINRWPVSDFQIPYRQPGKHNIKPVVEIFPFDKVNEALARLASGKAKYRIVLSNQ